MHAAQRFADPSVVSGPAGLIATSTGPNVPRASSPGPAGPWTPATPALASLPEWATGNAIWAADLQQVGDRWLLYYSVPVGGLGAEGRCIAVASSDTALGTFTPVGDRPLVCPKKADTPRAYDVVPRARAGGLPLAGVIDPSVFVDGDRRTYLMYKTQSRPSSIRMLRLQKRGARPSAVAGVPVESTELLRSDGIMENPALVKRRSSYVLFTSQGKFSSCRYRTYWRRASTLAGLATAEHHTLLSRTTTGVCGPAGADTVRRGGATVLFFHGWMCGSMDGPPYSHCPANFNVNRDADLGPRRALFAARLRFTGSDRPKVRFFYASAEEPTSP